MQWHTCHYWKNVIFRTRYEYRCNSNILTSPNSRRELPEATLVRNELFRSSFGKLILYCNLLNQQFTYEIGSVHHIRRIPRLSYQPRISLQTANIATTPPIHTCAYSLTNTHEVRQPHSCLPYTSLCCIPQL